MNYHIAEYRESGLDAHWLDAEHASNAFETAMKYSSKTRYGLNEKTVANISQLKIDDAVVAKQWLRENFDSSGTVQIIYDKHAVCVINTIDLLNHWQDIFYPSRDDAFVLHDSSNAILFYCHEEVIEIGDRKE